MQRYNITSPIVSLLPALAFLPCFGLMIAGFHWGGLEIIGLFISSSIQPSLDKAVIGSAFAGMKITIYIAFLSWIISSSIGIIFGIASSSITLEVFKSPKWFIKFIRIVLAIPRSIHEILWGLILLQFLGLSSWVAILAIVIPYSSLIARVISNQLDTLDPSSITSLIRAGVNPLSTLITGILPKTIPILKTYLGYRLECALRGATLLGVFGLGGIGTELQLTMRSLQFREMWTSLWILIISIMILEQITKKIRNWPPSKSKKNVIIQISLIFLISALMTQSAFKALDINLLTPINFYSVPIPKASEWIQATQELNLPKLIVETLILTFLASGIAIGIPPLMIMLYPKQSWIKIQIIVWTFFRIIPPPLWALLFLLCTTPSIGLAALSLGIHHLGVMGKLLKEKLEMQERDKFIAIKSIGADLRPSWLYGTFSAVSPSYLAYAAYRTDVLLRETAVVGIVGGSGLGWELIESISSFNWSKISILILVYSCITIIGEFLSDYCRNQLIFKKI